MEQVSKSNKIYIASIAVRGIMHHTQSCVLAPDPNMQECTLETYFLPHDIQTTAVPFPSAPDQLPPSVKYPPTLSPLPGSWGCVLLETHVENQRFSAWIETNMRKVVGSKHSLETRRETR